MDTSSKTGIIIPVRSDSTRLPGKHRMMLTPRMTLLDVLISRMQEITPEVEIVLAVPGQQIVEWERNDVKVYGDSHYDVLGRIRSAALWAHLDRFVLVWGDSPLMCPRMVDRMLSIQRYHDYDVLENLGPSGFRAKVVKTDFAIRWREFILGANEHAFQRAPAADWETIRESPSKLKFSVDTYEDLEFVKRVIGKVGIDGTLDDIVSAAESLSDSPDNGQGDPTGHTQIGSSPVD